MSRCNINHTDHKTKNANARRADASRRVKYGVMEREKIKDSVRENFFRPAYGKIGDR